VVAVPITLKEPVIPRPYPAQSGEHGQPPPERAGTGPFAGPLVPAKSIITRSTRIFGQVPLWDD